MTAGLSSNLAKVGQLDFSNFPTRQPDGRTISDLRIEGLSFLVLKRFPGELVCQHFIAGMRLVSVCC